MAFELLGGKAAEDEVAQIDLGDKPPKAEKSAKPKAAPKGRRGMTPFVELEKRLSKLMQQIGDVLSKFTFTRDDGAVVSAQAEPFAEAWTELAKTNKDVHKALTMMTTGGVWGGVVAVSASIAIPIMANHGLIPAGFLLAAEGIEEGEGVTDDGESS